MLTVEQQGLLNWLEDYAADTSVKRAPDYSEDAEQFADAVDDAIAAALNSASTDTKRLEILEAVAASLRVVCEETV